MYSHHYLTLLVCLSWTLAASQRCSKTIEEVCDNSNATEKSEFYALQLSSEEYSVTEKAKMQISGMYVSSQSSPDPYIWVCMYNNYVHASP